MSCRTEGSIGAVRLQAVSAGELGLQRLGASTRGAVIAKFEKSLYARLESDVFVCIGARAIGDGPLNVLIEPADWSCMVAVPLGERVEARPGTLDFGNRVRVALSRATPWRPRHRVAQSRIAPQQLRTLLSIAKRIAPEAGLSRLAFAPTGDDADTLLAFAHPAWRALESWLASSARPGTDDSVPAPRASRLIGLGPGLTPAGDDVFCGVLVALRFLERDRSAAALWRWLEPQLGQRTSALSAAHLQAAAMGQGHEALHAVLESIAEDGSALDEALGALGEIGHCSGWDALAGVVLVFHAALDATSRAASSAA